MRYLGGKFRQSKAIVAAVETIDPDFEVYVEPFCGAMWSATAMIKRFPERRYYFSDCHPALMTMWRAGLDGWEPPPPEEMTEELYFRYREERPVNDPMTGYLGFAWAFGGEYFGTPARGSDGVFKGSYASTVRKIRILRQADVTLSCCSYERVKLPKGAMVYLDPPYSYGRTPQASENGSFDRPAFIRYAEAAAERGAHVLSSEFVNDAGWPVVHDWGDTVVRHRAGKGSDGTRELLMRVPGGN